MTGPCLCIGGTLDGQSIVYRGEYFQAAIPEPLPLLPIALAEPVSTAMRTNGYRAEPFRCGATRWTIYIVDGLPTEEAFEQLLANYKRGSA